MKNFKKYILYCFLIFLILNCNILIINGNIDASSSTPTTSSETSAPNVTNSPSSSPNVTTTPKPTTKPTTKPSSSSSSAASAASSEASTVLDSSESSDELHQCAPDYSNDFSSSTSFSIGVSTIDDDPYKCALVKSNVAFTSSVKSGNFAKLSIGNTGCPSKCLSHSYSCSEISTTTDTLLSYGTYEFTVAASPVKNVNTKVFISSGGKSQYSDIFFLINGNSTKLFYGYTYFGQTRTFYDLLTGTDFSLDQKYKFIYTSGKLSFYYNNKLLQTKIESSIYNGINLPQPPMKFYFSVTNSDDDKIPVENLPTYSTISLFNYTSEMCSSSSDSEGENWNSNMDSPMYFFTSNCTNYRPIPIFNDSFNDGWEDTSKCLVQFPNSTNSMAQFARIGTSIGFALNSIQNYFQISINQSVPITRHKYIMFWINGGSKGRQSLALSLLNKNTVIGSINIGDYIHGSLEPYTWYKVVVPTRKIIINPVTIKTFTSFIIRGTSDTFLDMIYLDDIYFSNGTICSDESTQIPYYNQGTLKNGASGIHSQNNVNFNSTSKLFRGFKTIEYQVEDQNAVVISFMNGTVNSGELDLMKLNFFFVPDPQYNNNNNENQDFSDDNDLAGSTFILKLKICANVVTVGDLPCVGLSEYLGGQVLANKWVELLIPFSDLQIYPNALIQALSFRTTDTEHEGAFFIGDIQFANFVPPHVDEPEESFAFKLSINFNLLLLISILIITLI